MAGWLGGWGGLGYVTGFLAVLECLVQDKEI